MGLGKILLSIFRFLLKMPDFYRCCFFLRVTCLHWHVELNKRNEKSWWVWKISYICNNIKSWLVCTPNWIETKANGKGRRLGKMSKIAVWSKCSRSFKFLLRTQFVIKMLETLIQKTSMNVLSENIALIVLLQTISEKKLNRIRQLRLMTLY